MIESLKQQFAYYPLDFYDHFFLLLPVALAVYRREFLTPILVAVVVYFGIRFLEESVFLYYSLIPKNTQRLNKATLLLDILVIGGLNWLSFRDSSTARRLTSVVAGMAFGIALVNCLLDGMISISHSVLRLMMILFALAYFNKILAENRVRNILLHSFFWISAGFLFYGMGTFMTSLFKDYLLDAAKTSKETYNLFSDMNQMLSIILSLLTAVGLWVSKYDKDNYIQFT